MGVLLYFSFDYRGANDEALKQSFSQALQNEQAGAELYSALRSDRQSLFGGDLMRSIFLVALAAGILALALRSRRRRLLIRRFDRPDDRIDDLAQVVRRDIRGHADGDAR